MNQLSEKQKKVLSKTVFTYKHERKKLFKELPIDSIKKKAEEIRVSNITNLNQLWEKAKQNLENNGVIVHTAKDAAEAKNIFLKLTCKEDCIVKSKSNLVNELDLKSVHSITPTDIGDWIIHELKVEKCHPINPAAYVSTKEIQKALVKKGVEVSDSPEELVNVIKEFIRTDILKATVGVTGVNFVTSEGHIVIVENEGNASLVSHLPTKHVAFVPINRIVGTLEDAMTLSKCLSVFGSPQKSTAYYNIITSPSKTRDIQKKLITGIQGPEEVHLIVVDNGRTELLKDKKMKTVLNCIGCGSCLYFCPTYLELGNKFGSEYLGGYGIILSKVIGAGLDGLFDCLGCEACEDVCPVGVKIFDNIKTLRGSMHSVTDKKMREQILTKGNAIEDSNVWEVTK